MILLSPNIQIIKQVILLISCFSYTFYKLKDLGKSKQEKKP